jgi:hypothetical protein
MNNITDSSDPLLQAIAEFDGAVDRLIDEQIALLNSTGSEFVVSSADEPAVRLRRYAQASKDENPAGPAPTLGAPPTARADDGPKQRLDALARHLDDRLRRERKAANPLVNS